MLNELFKVGLKTVERPSKFMGSSVGSAKRNSRKKKKSLLPSSISTAVTVVKVGMVLVPVVAVTSLVVRIAKAATKVKFSAKDLTDDGDKRIVIGFKDVFINGEAPVGLAIAAGSISAVGSIKTAFSPKKACSDEAK